MKKEYSPLVEYYESKEKIDKKLIRLIYEKVDWKFRCLEWLRENKKKCEEIECADLFSEGDCIIISIISYGIGKDLFEWVTTVCKFLKEEAKLRNDNVQPLLNCFNAAKQHIEGFQKETNDINGLYHLLCKLIRNSEFHVALSGDLFKNIGKNIDCIDAWKEKRKSMFKSAVREVIKTISHIEMLVDQEPFHWIIPKYCFNGGSNE